MLFGGFASLENAHPYISIPAVFTAYSPLLISLPSTSPSPRLLILWLSQRLLLLRESHLCAVSGWYLLIDENYSSMRTAQGYSVPNLRLALNLGFHSSPGFFGSISGSIAELPSPYPYLLVKADNPSRLFQLNDDSDVDSYSYPYWAMLDGDSQSDSKLPPFILASKIDDQSLPWRICFHLYTWGAGISPVRRLSYQRSFDLCSLP